MRANAMKLEENQYCSGMEMKEVCLQAEYGVTQLYFISRQPQIPAQNT